MSSRNLVKSERGTIHKLRPGGRTHCGKSIKGETGYLFTSEEGRMCFNCYYGGLRSRIPVMRYVCHECGWVFDKKWEAERHMHIEVEHG